MRRLQVGGAADDLAFIARGAFEQHVDRGADRRPVEGVLLAVDQFLKPCQAFVHCGRCNHLLHVRGGRARSRRILERIGPSVTDLRHQREGSFEVFLSLAGEADDEIR